MGRWPGSILFADNLPSRAAGRQADPSLQAIPRPPRLRDPLLVMVDQEGGLVKRVGGAPSASAREMGERGPAFSREQGRRTALNLRNVGVNVDLAPVLDVARPGRRRSPKPNAPSARRRRRSRRPRSRSRSARGRRRRRHRQALPGLRLGPRKHRLRGAAARDLESRLRRVDEAPYRTYIAAGGDLVMLSTAIYPAFSGAPPRSPARSPPASSAAGSASTASRSPTRSNRSRSAPSAAPRGGACRRRRRRRPPPLRRPRRGARRSAGAQPRPRLARALADGIRTIGQPRPSPPAPTALNLRLACHLTARRDSSP